MEANSLSLLQQLAANPQLVDQLQTLLSIISPRAVPPPAAALSTSSAVSPPPVPAASPAPADPPPVSPVSPGDSLRRREDLALRCRRLEDELRARAEAAAAAAAKRAELEREVARLQRRLDESAEAAAAELRSRDEAHEHAVRQLIAAQRMVHAASQAKTQRQTPPQEVPQAQEVQRAQEVRQAQRVQQVRSASKRERPPSGAAQARQRRRTPRTPSPTAADRAVSAAAERAPRATAPFAAAASPGPAAQTVSEAVARQRGGAQTQFVSRYANPLHAAAPVIQPPSASRTPRARGMRSGTSSVVAGPTRSPSPVNPKRGAEQPRRFVVTSLTEEERARVRQAVASLGQHGVVMESDYEDPPPFTATHIIVRGAPRSMKALCGVVAAKWLVAPEYVYDSCSAGFWLDEYEEGGLRCFPPPLKCQRFLLSMPDGIVKEKLEQVIEYGGGEVLRGERNGRKQSVDQGVVVITSGDELLRFATRVE